MIKIIQIKKSHLGDLHKTPLRKAWITQYYQRLDFLRINTKKYH
jgi:hypothetical protein